MLNLKDYTSSGFPLPIGAVITLMLIALSVVMFIITYRKRYTVALLRSLIRHKARDESSAKTLKALKLSDNRSIQRALSRSGQLTFIVKRVGDVKPDYEEYVKISKVRGYKDEKIDFSSAEFYISEEEYGRAETVVEKTNTSWWVPSICSAFSLAVLVLAFFYLEKLLLLL